MINIENTYGCYSILINEFGRDLIEQRITSLIEQSNKFVESMGGGRIFWVNGRYCHTGLVNIFIAKLLPSIPNMFNLQAVYSIDGFFDSHKISIFVQSFITKL